MSLISKSIIAALVLGSSAVASANNDLIGNWKTKKVECISPRGNQAPKYRVNLDLAVQETTFTAKASMDSRTCNLKGTYTYTGGTIAFKVTDAGGCPMGGRNSAAFDATINGREAIVSLTGMAAAYMCNNQPTSLDIVMEKL